MRKLSRFPFEIVLGDIRDRDRLIGLFNRFHPDIVMHCAGLKAVNESFSRPLDYYENNVQGTVQLLQAMDARGCNKIIFSSSAAVYGCSNDSPMKESHLIAPESVYGRTKALVEQMLAEWVAVNGMRAAVNLRYFNPIGAHQSGEIGENPSNIPSNLLPLIADVACNLRPQLSIYGGDYATPDGTGVRDYVHVQDLAEGHLAAIDYVMGLVGVDAFNLGTGVGYSVLEVIKKFEQITQKTVPYEIVGRRKGDTARAFANPEKASELLGWRAKMSIEDMCADM